MAGAIDLSLAAPICGAPSWCWWAVGTVRIKGKIHFGLHRHCGCHLWRWYSAPSWRPRESGIKYLHGMTERHVQKNQGSDRQVASDSVGDAMGTV